MSLGVLPAQSFQSFERELLTAHFTTLNKEFSDQKHLLEETRHETLLLEKPIPDRSLVRPLEVYRLPAINPLPRDINPDIKLNDYEVLRDYGQVKVRLKIDPILPIDYVVIRQNDDGGSLAGGFDFYLDAQTKLFKVSAAPRGLEIQGGNNPRKPLAILKLSQRLTLAEIFQDAGITPAKQGFLDEIVDSTVRERAWEGLIMFSVPLAANPQEGLLDVLTPKSDDPEFVLKYLAISPDKQGAMSVNGRVHWSNSSSTTFPGGNGSKLESAFRMNEIDIAWYDSSLTFFHADADLHFNSFFGLRTGDKSLNISGSYDKDTKTIRFIGQFSDPLRLFSNDLGFGPFKQVLLKSAEIKFVQGSTAIHLDGRIELKSFSLVANQDCSVGDQSFVDFKGLQIRLTGFNPSGPPRGFSLDYPSIQIKVDLPPFKLGFLEAKIGSFGIDFGDNAFPWKEVVIVKGGSLGTGAFRFDLRLELMKLPELALASVDRLMLDFTIALSRNESFTSWSFSNMQVGIRAASFDKLKIDLMRFLSVRAENISFEPKVVDGVSVNWLSLIKLRVEILSRVIVDELSAWIYSAPGARRGFLAYLPKPVSSTNLKIHWVLIGQNIEIEENLAKSVMAITSPNVGESESLAVDIRNAADRGALIPRNTLSKRGEWIFGAGFTFFEVLEGKFLFQDNAYYGICIGGPLLEKWFGYNVAFSILYIKGREPGQDTFVASVRVPWVITDSFTFMGGVVTVEIVMDGGFTLDVGFPWLAAGGSRQWDRTFGAIADIYQGSGGFYIRKRNLPESIGPESGLCLSAGYAFQAGFGWATEGNVYRVWATVGIYYVLEGTVHLQNVKDDEKKIRGGRLVGAQGLLGRASGELNWWVISIRLEILLSAEGRATLEWGTMCSGQISDNTRTKLILDVELYANVHADACVGSGWFKFCQGIDITIPFHFSRTFFLSK